MCVCVGLTNATELNGKRGIVLGFDTARERYYTTAASSQTREEGSRLCPASMQCAVAVAIAHPIRAATVYISLLLLLLLLDSFDLYVLIM